jgi:hypothetical protein
MGGILTALLGSYAPVTPAFESIATITATGGETSLGFTSIPGTYTSLQVRGIVRDTDAGTGWNYGGMTVNNDTGSNYAQHYIRGNGTSVQVYGNPNMTTGNGILAIGNGSTAGIFGVVIMDFHDYASTTRYKTIRSFVGGDSNGAGLVVLNSTLWQSTSAITSIQILDGATAFAAGSTFSLYGIKGA